MKNDIEKEFTHFRRLKNAAERLAVSDRSLMPGIRLRHLPLSPITLEYGQ